MADDNSRPGGHPKNTEGSDNEQNAAEILREAADIVQGDRETHGEAVENHRHIADLINALFSDKLNEDFQAHEVADLMVLVKMSRRYKGTAKPDHRRDVAGYTGIAHACELADGVHEE